MSGIPLQGVVIDTNGNPVTQALIVSKKKGTSTDQALYEDEALSTPASNPHNINNSAGYYVLYRNPLWDYDVQIKSADEATTYNAFTLNGGGDGADAFIIVDTLSELQNLTGADAEDVVEVLGRTAAGDGYRGTFRWVSGDQSANITADPGQGVWVAPSAISTGASGAWKRILVSGTYQAEWWGVVGDNSTDNTTNLQRAIDFVDAQAHATSSEAGTIHFGAGTFRWTSVTLGNRVSIKGLGPYVTHFITTSTTDHLIKVGAGVIDTNDNTLEGFSFAAASAQTSGGGIITQNSYNTKIRDVREDSGNLYRSIDLQGGEDAFKLSVQDCVLNGGSDAAIVVGGTTINSSTRGPSDITLQRLLIGSESGSDGIRFVNTSGVYADTIDVIGRRYAFSAEPGSGEVARNMFFRACQADTCTSHGWRYAGTGNIEQVDHTACWAASCGKTAGDNGVYISNTTLDSWRWNGGQIINNGGSGVEVIAGINWAFDGAHIHFNNTDLGSDHGINIGNNVDDWKILNCIIGLGGQFSPERHTYGIQIGTGCEGYQILDNDLEGNVTGAINNNSKAATGSKIRNNKGYVTRNTGTITYLTTDSGSISTAHGLAETPTASQVRFMPTTDSLGHRFWPGTPTSSNLLLNMNAGTPSSDIVFAWEIDLYP